MTTDSDIDLDQINKLIYKDDIEGLMEENPPIQNCISRDDKYRFGDSKDTIDYKKYFAIRLKGTTKSDSGELDLDSSYDISEVYVRKNNVDTNGSSKLKEKWVKKYSEERKLFIDSIIASVILTHKYKEYKKHSLMECNNVLDDINGCYCIFPFIEIDKSKGGDTETVYNITLPERLKLLNPDAEGMNGTSIDNMFADPANPANLEDKTVFITKLDIKINDNITYEDLKKQIIATPFMTDCIYESSGSDEDTSLDGVNFIDGINNIIDHEIYKEFINTINHENARTGAFDNFIETKKSNGELRLSQFWKDKNSISSNYDELLNPLYIVPKANIDNIRKLRNEMEKFIQKKIDTLYNNVPKINDTKTKFIYEKMIINSIYFHTDTYRSREDDETEDEHSIVLGKADAENLNDKISDDGYVVKLKHYGTGTEAQPEEEYYHFHINVQIPICNTSPIRKNISDVLLSNNLIVIIISYLVAILIHAFISCCLEFWLKYGNGTTCIYIINTCKNIGDKSRNETSLIDYYFRHRLSNFPYQHCDKALVQSGGNTNDTNVPTFNYPILKQSKDTICINEDYLKTYSDKRPFPYSIIDYGEENFDSESIKYFFRTIVILILCLLIPLRYIFNKCIGTLSKIYNNYISRNFFLSSIIFVLLPLSVPLILILTILSLACSLILYFIYSIITMIHNVAIIFFPLIQTLRCDGLKQFILGLFGTIFSLATFILIMVAIFQPKWPAGAGSDRPEGGIIFQGFHRLPTHIKFIVLICFIVISIFLFAVKSMLNPGRNFIDHEINVSKYMQWLYNIILYPFDYSNLTTDQQGEFTNYRVDKLVDRTSIGKHEYAPLKEFLTCKSAKFSPSNLVFMILILAVIFHIVANNRGYDFSQVIGVFLSIYIYIILNNKFFSYLIEFRTKYNSATFHSIKFENLNWLFSLPRFLVNLLIFFIICIFTNVFAFLLYGETILGGDVNDHLNMIISNINDENASQMNNLNITSEELFDISELVLLFKKFIYLICVTIVSLFTMLVLPFVMIITLLYIFLNLLYIFLIVPFTKGGHFIFKIMSNRYKILTYMLCTAIISAIYTKQIFSDNTEIVVYTMSGILGLIIIYNFVNE